MLDEGVWKEPTTYLRSLGALLSRQYGRPEITHHFAWVDSSDINAFATPGGYIFLTRGLFETLATEDELVTVLLHEIAHITEKHVFKKVTPPPQQGFAFTLARALSGGRADLSVAVSQGLQQGLKLLLEEGLGPELEKQADEEAVAIASHLAYSPQALNQLLKRAQVKTKEKGTELPKTHPKLDDRLQWLDQWILRQQLQERYQQALQTLKAPALKKRTHRIKGIQDSQSDTST